MSVIKNPHILISLLIYHKKIDQKFSSVHGFYNNKKTKIRKSGLLE